MYTTILEKKKTLHPTRKHLYTVYLTSFAENNDDILKLADTLEHGAKTIGTPAKAVKLEIIKLIYSKGLFNKNERERLFNLINDNSSNMVKEKKRLEVMEVADPQEREQLWDTFINPPSDVSSRVQQSLMFGFNNERIASKHPVYASKFFDVLMTVYEKTTYDYFNIFYHALFPDWSEDYDEILTRINLLLETVPQKYTQFTKFLIKSKEEVERIRRNKLLCTMSRAQASTIYPWVKAPRFSVVPKEPELVIEEIKESKETEVPFQTRESRDEEVVRSVERPIKSEEKSKSARHVVIAEEQNQEIEIPSQVSQEPAVEKQPAENITNTETIETVENVSETTPVANLTTSVIEEEKKSGEESTEVQDLTASGLVEGQNLRLSLGPEEEFQYKDLRLSLSFNEGKGDNLEEILGSADREGRDGEDTAKNLLKKSWRKQASYSRNESVFKDWLPNTKAVYVNMFKTDVANFSIHKFITPNEEVILGNS